MAQGKSLTKWPADSDTSVSTLVEEFTRDFAWGPNTKTATKLSPRLSAKELQIGSEPCDSEQGPWWSMTGTSRGGHFGDRG